jgi:hypothetical protein
MCYSPITIINPSKYINVKYKDRFLLQVPCGKCAECQKRKSSEWNYRTYFEFIHTHEANENAFVYFDTLTYDDEHLPHMDEIHIDLPHIPCFRSKDLTDFFKRLRTNLSRKFGIDKDAFSYFVCSEYGSLKGRPHYHLLLFMRKPINYFALSKLISSTWYLGRTDGIPYKSAFYVERHNVIKNARLGDVLACAKYVTKYVEKDCKLQDVIDKRIKNAELVLGNVEKNGSVKYRKLVTKLASEVNQFHLQSLHYGELSLRDIDINELIKSGCVVMPSHEIVSYLPVPMYCLRKMFYEKYKLHGVYGWQLNEIGRDFKRQREPYIIRQMQDRFEALCILANVKFDCKRLANYVVRERGRYKDAQNESIIEERIKNPSHYLYVTQSDKENIGVGISLEFLGNSKLGFAPFEALKRIKIKDFIEKYVFLDDELEAQLKVLYAATSSIDDGEQKYYSRVQELKSLFKTFF